jgi:hypothetical protein
VEIYKKFAGDIDHFARTGSAMEKLDISDDDWRLIESFLQDLALVDNGLAADSFVESLEARIKVSLESAELTRELKILNKK